MRLTRENAAAKAHLDTGSEVAMRVRRTPETAPLAAVLDEANANVAQKIVEREKRALELREARIEVDFAEDQVETQVRKAAAMVENADGGKRGPLFARIFEDGLTAVVDPSGRAQLDAVDRLTIAFETSKMASVDKVRAEVLPPLKQAREVFAKALDAREKALAELARARAAEEEAKLDHLSTMDKIAAELRLLFPRDRKRQDLFFPPAERSRRSAELQAEEPPEVA